MRIEHDIDRKGTLYFLLSAFLGAYNKRSDSISGGLKAIALALSTPNDNSAQVQAEIDKYVAQLNTGTAEVQDAINQHNKGV